MNLPSIKTLSTITDTPADAKLLRKILEARTHDTVCALSDAASSRMRECYSRPDIVNLQLHAANAILRGHGVEYFDARGRRHVEYVNQGDAYSPTLCLVEVRGHWGISDIAWRVIDWGTLAERYDAQ